MAFPPGCCIKLLERHEGPLPMRKTKYAAAFAGVTMLAGSLFAVPAGATAAGTNSTTAGAVVPSRCGMSIGAVTAAGDMGGAGVRATKPPTRGPGWGSQFATPPHLFPAGSARLSTNWEHSVGVGADFGDSGLVVMGSTLYGAAFSFDGAEGSTSTVIIGGGWGNFRAVERSLWTTPAASRPAHLYGLRNDGVLFRWEARTRNRGSESFYQPLGSYPGFSSVKGMTLISETATYDTFLVNLRGGSLYTIHIPHTSPMKPVVKQVRSRTWQAFEVLVADRCGARSTLLTGIDKDTRSAHLYAVGHATGTTTPIVSLGKIPGTFPDPLYFLHDQIEMPEPMNGE